MTQVTGQLPITYVHPQQITHLVFTVCAIWTLLLANLYCLKYGLKCSFTVKLYLSIMYALVTKSNYINYNSVNVCLNDNTLVCNMNYECLLIKMCNNVYK